MYEADGWGYELYVDKVIVSVVGTGLYDVTGADGTYRIEGLAYGDYVLQFDLSETTTRYLSDPIPRDCPERRLIINYDITIGDEDVERGVGLLIYNLEKYPIPCSFSHPPPDK